MTNAFHLRVFGPPVLLGLDGDALKFRTKKQLALLVYLSLDNDHAGVSRDTLVDLLWPEAGSQRGRHSLSQGLSAIRRQLGSHAVKSSGNRLRLMTSLPTDLDVVGKNGRIAGNLAHPLQDLDDCSGPDFAHWVDASREHMLQVARAELLRVFHDARRQGDVERVQLLALQLYEVDPLNEQAVQAMAERRLLEGDIAKAIGLLRDFLTRTAEAEGESDHVHVRRLLERIESGAHPPADIVPTERLAGARNRQGDSYFVGRAEELAHLEAMWEQAKAGKLRTCLMRGVAGIGKSSILKRFATAVAARGNLAVAIRCQEIGAAVPFSALADLIEVLSRDPALSGTDPYWLAEASRIAPLLRAKYPGLPEPGPAPGESIRLRVAEAVYRMFETVAENAAMCLVIDDLQHMDQASKDVLHVVTRRLVDSPALILAATRTEGFDHPSISQRVSSNLVDWQDTIDLRTLTREESAALVGRLSPDLEGRAGCEAIRARMVSLADGNPYFLEMLVSDWRTHGNRSLAATETAGNKTGAKWRPPDALRLTFSRHYEGLGSRGRQAIELLAVAGRAMNAPELGELLGIGTVPASQLVLEIIERGVLRLEGDAVSFKNELHRAFVYYATPDTARRYHHARLAHALVERAQITSLPGHLEAAHHFVQAGMLDEATESVVVGAESAISHGALREAERALRDIFKILPSKPSIGVLLLAEALNQQGQYREALNWLSRISKASLTKPGKDRLTALTAEAWIRGRIGDPDEIERAVQRGLTEARVTGGHGTTLRILHAEAELAADKGDTGRLIRAEEQARTIAQAEQGTEIAAQANMTTGFCLFAQGRYADAYNYFTASAAILDSRGHASLVRIHNGRGMCAAAVGEYSIAREAYERGIFLAERTGDYPGARNVAANYANALWELGLFIEGEGQIERALEFHNRAPEGPFPSQLFNNAAELAIAQEDFGRAAAILEKTELESRAIPFPRRLAQTLLTKADFYFATGLEEEALKLIAEAEGLLPDSSDVATASFQGSMSRLLEYRAWRLGKRPVQLQEERIEDRAMGIAGLVELTAFKEWLAEQTGSRTHTRPNATDLVRTTGLDGVKIYLEVVGMFPANVEITPRADPN